MIEVQQGTDPHLAIDAGLQSADPHGRIWIVRLEGVQPVCPRLPGGPCNQKPAMSTVYLDFATGALLRGSTIAAP